jgi:hypothetical protein
MKVRPWSFAATALLGTLVLAALDCLSVYVRFGHMASTTVPVALAFGALAAGMLSALYHIPHDVWARVVVPNFGYIAAGVLIVSYFYWLWYASARGKEAGSEFYGTAAQIIPVFLLAALIDARQTRDANRWQTAIYFVVIALGESVALLVLAFDVRNSMTFAQVAASVSGAVAGLACALLSREEDPDRASAD